MKKKIFNFILICFLILPCFIFAACDFGKNDNGGGNNGGSGSDGQSNISEELWDDNETSEIEIDDTEHNFTLTSNEDGTYTYTCTDEGCNETISFTVKCEKGTAGCCSVDEDGDTITFSEISEKSAYSISGKFYGNIVIDTGDDYKFELSLEGFSITSSDECPIAVETGDEVTISAKNGTTNYIYDLRDEIGDEDESYKGAIHAECDLNVQGKGELFVKSKNNNGIHTKNDLLVKNLTLEVDCTDNALKGNDSVTIEGGNLTLIASAGDGIKTTDSDESDKGKQRGTITISGGTILVYAACDGIDASYDVVVNESSASVDLQIYTDKYSKFSDEVTAVDEDTCYVRYESTTYKYSLKFYDNNGNYVWKNSSNYVSVPGGRGNFYYYPISKPSGYTKVQLFIYDSSKEQGQDTSYTASTDILTINSGYDTLALQNRGGGLGYSWTNYSTNSMGPGGMQQEGNTDKGDYSTKGIKADNKITISAGMIVVQSYDDAVHANNDVELENSETPLGDVTISGGNLKLYTNDDGIHADGALSISGGTIKIENCYEGLEGATVAISDGDISVISKDDGINGTAESGTSITISGGTLYIYAGGDGADSNSRTSYSGIVFSGGQSVIIATSDANSSIDTENGYKYLGGKVVAVGRSGGMNSSESKNCSNFSSVGKTTTLSLSKDNYLVVSNFATVKMPLSQNSTIVVLGSTSSSISQSSSTTCTLDDNGVYWN